jgi:hypothetical protein
MGQSSDRIAAEAPALIRLCVVLSLALLAFDAVADGQPLLVADAGDNSAQVSPVLADVSRHGAIRNPWIYGVGRGEQEMFGIPQCCFQIGDIWFGWVGRSI